MKEKSRLHRCLPGCLFGLLFASGLVVDWFAPRPRISGRFFEIHMDASGSAIHPADLIESARRTQLLAASLTVAGALGLFWHYRHLLTRRPNPNPTPEGVCPEVSRSEPKEHH